MYVRTLIGRNAGDIIDLPHHAATSGLSMGTCESVTDDEIVSAGFPSMKSNASAPAEAMPEGYSAAPTELGGYLLSGPDGKIISEQPFPNLSAARNAAETLAEEAKGKEEIIALKSNKK